MESGTLCDSCQLDDNGNSEIPKATQYCTDCDQYYCSKCSEYHGKQRATMHHKTMKMEESFDRKITAKKQGKNVLLKRILIVT